MASTINTNIASLTAQRNLTTSQSSLQTSIERLSSGLRINSAKDDAAGLAISERFTSQVRGLNMAVRNANDGVSFAQTAEGGMKAAGEVLQRVRELAVQSANASNSASDRRALQQEVSQLVAELDRLAQNTEFNGTKLLDGSFGTQQFQVGANANQTIVAATANMRTTAYGNHQVSGANASGASGASGTGAVSAVFSTSGVSSGSIEITGSLGTKSIPVSSGAHINNVAAAINLQTANTGVTATARTEAQLTFTSGGAYSIELQSNNTTAEKISFSISPPNTAEGLSSALSAINERSATTGVTASLNQDATGIILTNPTGNTIAIGDTTSSNAGNINVAKVYDNGSGGVTASSTLAVLASGSTQEAVAINGYLTFNSDKGFSVVSSNTNAVGASPANSDLKRVSDLDVTTFGKATLALKTVDSALAYVASERAKLGALQSRFETSISALQIASENTSAARGRVLDADFAVETANLSRAQILQQAGTAMIAQANQIPQGVLSLLQ